MATDSLTAVPRGWSLTTLAKLLVPVPKKQRQIRVRDATMYRLLTVRLYAKGIVERELVGGEHIGTKQLYRTLSGDFVFSKIDARNGAWGFVPDELSGGLVSADFPILCLNPVVVERDFLAFAMSRPEIWAPLRDIAVGTTNRRRVQVRELLQIGVLLPPPAEQPAIAQALGTVQRAREATEAVIAAGRELKRSLMRHLFTYGPVSLTEAERVPLKETVFGQIPEDWIVLPLERCARIQTGAAKGRRLEGDDTTAVPYLRVANVQDGYLDLSEIKDIRIRRSELERYSLEPGDVLLTEGGDFDKLGRGFVWEGQIPVCAHQNHIFAVRTDRSRLLPHYLAYLSQSDYGKAYFLTVAHRTTHLACINSTKLKAFPVPLPPLQEQEAIAGALGAIDRKIEAEEKRRAALEELFRSLLQQLMTGQVRLDVPGTG